MLGREQALEPSRDPLLAIGDGPMSGEPRAEGAIVPFGAPLVQGTTDVVVFADNSVAGDAILKQRPVSIDAVFYGQEVPGTLCCNVPRQAVNDAQWAYSPDQLEAYCKGTGWHEGSGKKTKAGIRKAWIARVEASNNSAESTWKTTIFISHELQ